MEKPNIIEIIGQYIPIKPSGKEWIACCPFHDDRHPSFSINEEEGVFFCFGCGVSGDVIDFLMRWSGKPFSEVCRYYDLTWKAKPLALSYTEMRNRFLATLFGDWAREFSLRVACRMRDLGQDIDLADDNELSEELQREWDILETLHEDLNEPEFIVELYENREELESLVG